MKKGIIFIVTIIVFFVLTILGVQLLKKDRADTNKVKVIATLYPQYDFAKRIGGDKIDVSMLLPAGAESHTYEPTPKDIASINSSNLFIYTGKYMEPWAEKIVSSIDTKSKVLDVSKNIKLINEEEFEEQHGEEDHDHEEHEHEGHEHSNDEHEEHHHEFDPHIWLDPQNAIIMVNNIKDELCKIDSKNADYYEGNANKLVVELNKLDNDIAEKIKNSKKNKIAFGGSFAYAYFIEKYKLEYISAYDTCGEGAEPSVSKLKEVVDYMKQNDIKVVFCQEQSNGKIADTIAEQTGAKKLVFHTIHNASSDEIKNGEGYVSIMYKNLENLKEALN